MWSSLKSTIKNLFGPSPNDVNGQFSLANCTEREHLFLELLASVDVTGCPEEWDKEYLKKTLLGVGYICITDTTIGVIPIECGYYGQNYMHLPTHCIIANPVLGSFERKIGEECSLVHCKPDYQGFHSLLNLYSYFMAACDSSISINLLNSHVTFIAECDNPQEVKQMKKMYEQISNGEPAVYSRKGVQSQFFYLNPKNSYIVPEIIESKKSLRAEYLSLIGIKTVKNEKRERMISAEVESGNDETMFNMDHVIDTINEGFDVANRLYGLNLKASLKRHQIDNQKSIDNSETLVQDKDRR